MARRGALGIRVDNYMDPASAHEVLATGPSADATGRVRLRGIKLYADGALGSRGAALLEQRRGREQGRARRHRGGRGSADGRRGGGGLAAASAGAVEEGRDKVAEHDD